VVRFVAGSLDLGYVYDIDEPPTSKAAGKRARWVTHQTSDGALTLQWEEEEEAAAGDRGVPVETATQTDEQPEQMDAAVQTEAKAFSTIRKDLPQFSRPAKHSVK